MALLAGQRCRRECLRAAREPLTSPPDAAGPEIIRLSVAVMLKIQAHS